MKQKTKAIEILLNRSMADIKNGRASKEESALLMAVLAHGVAQCAAMIPDRVLRDRAVSKACDTIRQDADSLAKGV